ncbi:hypothetical protein [Pseudovibrio sp. Tun.PSC04-5.I4]|uniref:hypothetical protein n=1 Tax=Pseudovibrio sp. Tun.PSC04-5.I4 TaxID=1798213 RepID=UPI00088E8B57|nr:hypothetical protein [Pseudovibrio sp. Tun.PSC04-5.I4]SDR14960.1 hypothetical protein SAMN04515695_3026 [Pseudovibrio sp. Tun.PSC04-5.I4]
MVAIPPISSPSTADAIEPSVQLGSSATAKRVETVPAASQLLSVGVSAAFGLQPPPDTTNLEVLVSQVVAKFEEIQSALKEQNLIGDSEKVRSVRTALLISLAKQDEIAAEIVGLETQQKTQEDQLSELNQTLSSKQAELAALPNTTPLDPEDADSELGPDPTEVTRLTDEMAQLNIQIGDVETALAGTLDQLDTAEDNLAESGAVQTVLRTALNDLMGSKKMSLSDDQVISSLEEVIDKAASELRAVKPEFDQRQIVIEELREDVRILAEEGVKDEISLMNLVEAEYALQVVNFIRETISGSLELANEALGGQSVLGTGGRVQLLLDNGRV